MKRMRCNYIGVALISFSIGILIGGLMPNCIIVWIMGLALLAAGFLLLYC